MGILGGVIGAVGSVAGSLLGNKGAKDNVAAANAANREMAQNAVQWRVEDMRKAGINPILAAHSGSNFAASSAPAIAAPGPDYSSVVSSASGLMDTLTRKDQQKVAEASAASQIEKQKQEVINLAQDRVNKYLQQGVQRQQELTGNAQEALLREQALTEASKRASLEAQAGLSSARAARENYKASEDRILHEFRQNPVGRTVTEARYSAPAADALIGTASKLFGISRDKKRLKLDRDKFDEFKSKYK